MQQSLLDTPIEFLKGVGPERAKLLKSELNISSFRDLISYYPFRYVDRTIFLKIRDINPDLPFVQVIGKIRNVAVAGAVQNKRLTAEFYDGTGTLELVWFKGIKWVKPLLDEKADFVIFGKPAVFRGKFSIAHPEINLLQPADMEGEGDGRKVSASLQPVYSTSEKLSSKGLNSKGIQKLLSTLFSKINGRVEENLSEAILRNWKMAGRNEALLHIHFPENPAQLKRAQSRLKFEELFFIQLELLRIKFSREKNSSAYVFSSVGENVNRFYREILPFPLTEAQKKVIKEIRRDLGSGKQMNRLLQGDVGSGKTIVALMAILIAIDNNFQSCLMAPTEILANQHFAGLSKLVEKLGIKIALLTGSVKAKERKLIHRQLLDGELQILVGTHALIEEGVRFKNLGLAVIDEQHRFGVEQRAKLHKKKSAEGNQREEEKPSPHILVMTATPIPRTLAMTLYGDLDVSVIDELPPGRKPIKTLHFNDSARLRVFGMMKQEIAKGHQVYVVYPLIYESEKLDYKFLMEGLEAIERSFPKPEYQVSVVHGQMLPQNRDFEMARFLRKETQILVSTTVIEVGVDVPNASVMVIENAERFGLSQLHQLRGRVGRGAEQSYCLLMTGEKLGRDGMLRMQTMVQTNDGFKIAETDLQLRGAGDLMGTQQSGEINLRIANLATDGQILLAARKTVEELLEKDSELKEAENLPIVLHLNLILKGKQNWSRIS